MLTNLSDLLNTIALIVVYLKVLPLSQLSHKLIASDMNQLQNAYDFIVVGAGTAGCVLASRLSEDRRKTVLLLEAGDSENVNTDVPSVALLFGGHDWNYSVDGRGRAFLNNVGGRGYLPRGKVMGGSSATNNMMYLRGSRRVYDDWAKLGLSNWSWDQVFPYFLKLEKNLDPDYNNGYHGLDGPLIITSPGQNFGPSKVYLDATRELGFNTIDLNGPMQIGCNVAQRNIKDGVRYSLSRAYLEKLADNRPNLTIKTRAFVTKILFRRRKAIGVQVDYRGATYKIKAKIEVLVSAGAVNSPQLLMLSGVGPSKHLKKHKIKVIANVKGVGGNVHDHVYIPLPNFGVFANSLTAAVPLIFLATDLSVPTCQANSIFNRDKNFPDVHIENIYFPLLKPLIIKSLYNLDNNAYNHYFGPYYLKPFFLTILIHLRPKSRGDITLNSAEPYDYPIIQPNYLKHPDDVRVLIDGMKLNYRIGKSRTFQREGVGVFQTRILGCQHLANDTYKQLFGHPTDQYLECAIRRHTNTGYHICGSCKMGTADDPKAVVDQELRVKKVKGLRVVDASIIPVIPNANTNAVVAMIAEKVADVIKKKYGLA